MNYNIFQNALEKSIYVTKDKTYPLSKENINLYYKYEESEYTVKFYQTLGKELSSKNLRILDVGSGTLKTASLLIENCKYVEHYTSIDNKIDANSYITSIIDKNIQKFSYIMKNVLEDNFIELSQDYYNILIIDIEPHGNEIIIYEKVKKAMQSQHLIILKHIGKIDLYDSSFADNFLDKYIKSKNICDYYAQEILSENFRDIFVIMSKNQVILNSKCQSLAKGQTAEWVDKKIPRIVLHK